MAENQNIEWKESWRDDYLKWIAAFANANGGTLFVGMDDKGVVVGLTAFEKHLEDIPNKIKDVLGILADVNLRIAESKHYIEIVVDSYPYPISYKGRYFTRSGSTTQELRGNELNKFLLSKVGKHWDGVPVPNVKVEDLSQLAFDKFREKAIRNNRIGKEILEDSNATLIDNLRLFDQEFLKRAAILLFHEDPEKYIPGAYIKIGFFTSDDDLRFQDEVHGSLIEQIEKVHEFLTTKYYAYMVEYTGISRTENTPFPEAAIREALLNAIAHKDYSEQVPIQISVYPTNVFFWNPGQLPQNWTIDELKKKHPSVPANPDIANALFRAGDIESWGRGTIKMIKDCISSGLLPPEFESQMSGFTVWIFNDVTARLKSTGLDETLVKVVVDALENKKITNKRVQELCGVSKSTATRYLDKLEEGYLEKIGETGKGTYYVIKGLIKGS